MAAKLLCAMFGHMRKRGWYGDGLYGAVRGGYADAIGRTHFQVNLECDRCGETYTAARFHGQQVEGSIRAQAKAEGQ